MIILDILAIIAAACGTFAGVAIIIARMPPWPWGGK